MPRGGARVGAGRKKGQASKSTEITRTRAAESGKLPLDYMLEVMRDPRQPKARRDEMAKACAPYLHARLSSTQISGNPNAPIELVTRIERVVLTAVAVLDGNDLEAEDTRSLPSPDSAG